MEAAELKYTNSANWNQKVSEAVQREVKSVLDTYFGEVPTGMRYSKPMQVEFQMESQGQSIVLVSAKFTY